MPGCAKANGPEAVPMTQQSRAAVLRSNYINGRAAAFLINRLAEARRIPERAETSVKQKENPRPEGWPRRGGLEIAKCRLNGPIRTATATRGQGLFASSVNARLLAGVGGWAAARRSRPGEYHWSEPAGLVKTARATRTLCLAGMKPGRAPGRPCSFLSACTWPAPVVSNRMRRSASRLVRP
jgi:hypothetical protein